MKKDNLYILWTNDNPLTAEHMVMMYSKNAVLRNWWNEVTVIIWGATSKLVAENYNIQQLIKEGQETGVNFSGCIACANNLGTTEKLTELGIELKSWGEPLTELLKNKENILTV
ncbi:DsrE family protein [Ilyobacter sp.]|uniref:DsrE family protein n=1 Tax=Ilyobacter sp. TaxID=3100343 RepID=UPI003562219B